jgi:hypothetical protein
MPVGKETGTAGYLADGSAAKAGARNILAKLPGPCRASSQASSGAAGQRRTCSYLILSCVNIVSL